MKGGKNISRNNNKFEFFTEVTADKNNKDGNSNDLRTSPSFQKELIFFKNEILKDITLLTKEISEKNKNYDLMLSSETNKLNDLIKNSEIKIKNLSNLISINNHTQSVLETLTSFQKKTESYIITNDIRFANLERELSENIYRHDSIIKESVVYPGVIGPSAQFKTFHELIDYILKQITELLSHKEKSVMEFITYKTKLDNKINAIKVHLDDFTDDISHKNKKEFNQMEAKINEFSLKIDEVIDTYKLENEKNLDDIIKKNNAFMEKIEENIKTINEDNIKIKKRLKKSGHKEIKEHKENETNRKSILAPKKQALKKLNSVQNFKDNLESSKISKNKNNEKKLTKGSSSKNVTPRYNNENNDENNDNDDNDSYESKSKISSSINYDIKNMENRLKQFIKDELKKISKNNNYNTNYNTSIRTISKNNMSRDSSYYANDINNKQIQKKSINKALSLSNKKINELKNINTKRQSFVPNNLSKNIFEKFMKSTEEKKKYIFEKIKEVFVEESSESSVNFENVFKKSENESYKDKEKEKNKNNKSFTEETITLKQPEFKKDVNYKQAYKTTTKLPFITKNKKTKKENLKSKTKIKEIPEISKRRKTINIKKTPIKKASTRTLSSVSFSSRAERKESNLKNLKKELLEQNSFKNNIEPNIKYNSIDSYLEKNKKMDDKIDLEKNNILNTNEHKKRIIIQSPQIRNKPKISNFNITLQGTQKFNIDSLTNKNKKYQFNLPTIYMNFPRKYSVYNEKILESLHPVYRNKKFSQFVPPYISLMTNNLQEMIRKYDRKSMQQKKRSLPWNKSENFLMNKRIQTNEQIKPKIKKEKLGYKNYGYENNIKLNDDFDMLDFNKFSHLIMKDI